jgi:DNA-binding transcriptional regulator YiaG
MNTMAPEKIETALAKPEKAILMKSGSVQWVTLETAERVESHLASQQGHSFIRLKDYDLTINSAEIEGVYTPEQYADIQKAKNGYWQCENKRWHFKREKCECATEMRRENAQADQEKKMADMNREQTPEDRARMQEGLKKMKEVMYIKGTFAGAGEVRESTLKEWEAENGRVPEGRRNALKIIKGK